MANRPRDVMLLQKQRFLEAFQRHGIVGRACDEAALRNKGGRVVVPGVERHTVARWLAADPEFAVAFAQAEECAADHVEAELFRRAVEGTPRDVYYQGVVVGTAREYSDQLLLRPGAQAAPRRVARAAGRRPARPGAGPGGAAPGGRAGDGAPLGGGRSPAWCRPCSRPTLRTRWTVRAS